MTQMEDNLGAHALITAGLVFVMGAGLQCPEIKCFRFVCTYGSDYLSVVRLPRCAREANCGKDGGD
eukprot:COSAG02_NODE_781_length_17261_cov_433.056054_2_plen_66_part_00